MKHADLEALRRDAVSSPLGESFTALSTRRDQRIGVGVRTKGDEADYFVEVIVTLCPEGELNLTGIEGKLSLLKSLEARGYALNCEGDGSISCEKHLPASAVEAEIETLQG